MKRLIPLFLVLICWLSVLLVPPLQRMFRIQVGGGSEAHRGWAYGPYPGGLYLTTTLQSPPADDYRALAVQLDRTRYPAGQPTWFDTCDALIDRFPKTAVLYTLRLNRMIMFMEGNRAAGEFAPYYMAGSTPPERYQRPPNYKKLDIEKALALARRGRKLEPDNAYFEWVEFYLLLTDWRDSEAWPALKRASHKIHFDAHLSDWVQSKVHCAELNCGRALTPEETLLVLRANRFYQNEQKVQMMGNIVLWQAVKAERRGDATAALAIRGDFARLMLLAARNAYSPYDLSTFRELADLMLRVDKDGTAAVNRRTTGNLSRNGGKPDTTPSTAFLNYAGAHGRSDLAREMRARRGEAGARWMRAFQSGSLYYGLPNREMAQVTALWWGASLFLVLAPQFLLWWLVLGGLLRWATVPKVEVERRKVARMTTLSFVAPLLCWTSALVLGAASHVYSIGQAPIFNEQVVAFVMRRPEVIDNLRNLLLALGLVAPGLLATYCSLHTAKQRESRCTFKDWLHSVRLSSMLINGGLAVLIVGGALLWQIRLSLAYLPFLNNFPWVYNFRFSPALPMGAFTLGVALLWLPPLLAPAEDRSKLAYRLRLLHRSLGALVVAASVSYVLLLAAGAPIRAGLETYSKQLVQRGEVALIMDAAQ